MKIPITITICDATGCDAETKDPLGDSWGRWGRTGRQGPIDVCPKHDRMMCEMFAQEIPQQRRRRKLAAVSA